MHMACSTAWKTRVASICIRVAQESDIRLLDDIAAEIESNWSENGASPLAAISLLDALLGPT